MVNSHLPLALEKVTVGGLGTMIRILRILEIHCRTLELKPSPTVYRKWGKGGKFDLCFSKSGEQNLEAAYSRHYTAVAKLNLADVESSEPVSYASPRSIGQIKAAPGH